MEHMPDIKQMYDSDQKSPSLPVNDTKMTADEQMPAKKQKRKKWTYYIK